MSQESHLQTATKALLKPLIKLLLNNGVSYNEFSEWSREGFVEVAEKEFAIEGKKQTSTRISVLTGIFRKDVARIRKNIAKPVPKDKTANRLVRIISAWRREFVDAEGEPLALQQEGDALSLEYLARQYGGDVSYQAIQSEMNRLGIIEVLEDETIALKSRAYVPSKDKNKQFDLMGQACADLLATIDHNIEQPEDSRFQMSVAYQGLSPETLEKFKVLSEKKSMDLLKKLDSWLAENLELDKDGGDSDQNYRAGLGLYYFQEKNN